MVWWWGGNLFCREKSGREGESRRQQWVEFVQDTAVGDPLGPTGRKHPVLEYIWKRIYCLSKDKKPTRCHWAAVQQQGTETLAEGRNLVTTFHCASPYTQSTHTGVWVLFWDRMMPGECCEVLLQRRGTVFPLLVPLRFGVMNPSLWPEIKYRRTVAPRVSTAQAQKG